jgi:hypothetical protein
MGRSASVGKREEIVSLRVAASKLVNCLNIPKNIGCSLGTVQCQSQRHIGHHKLALESSPKKRTDRTAPISITVETICSFKLGEKVTLESIGASCFGVIQDSRFSIELWR